MNDRNQMNISFSCYDSENGNWSFERAYDEGTKWDDVLSDFTRWLSSVYGYDLSQKIAIKDVWE